MSMETDCILISTKHKFESISKWIFLSQLTSNIMSVATRGMVLDATLSTAHIYYAKCWNGHTLGMKLCAVNILILSWKLKSCSWHRLEICNVASHTQQVKKLSYHKHIMSVAGQKGLCYIHMHVTGSQPSALQQPDIYTLSPLWLAQHVLRTMCLWKWN